MGSGAVSCGGDTLRKRLSGKTRCRLGKAEVSKDVVLGKL